MLIIFTLLVCLCFFNCFSMSLKFISGNNVIIHNTNTDEQKLLSSSSSAESITCIAVSNGGKFVAIGEKGKNCEII